MRAKRPGANRIRGETTQGANGIRGEMTWYPLKQQSKCWHVALLQHIIMIPSQPVFAFTPKCLVEKQQIPILIYSLWFERTRTGIHYLQHSMQAQ
jgi:hypothetical protein